MTAAVSQEMIEAARTRRPLSVVIGQYIKLRKVGTEYEGLCPFHNDRNPSLNVNDRKAVWLCRSCNVGGDAISFIQRHAGRSFTEAVSELADAPPETSAGRFLRQQREAVDEYATRPGTRWEPDAEQRERMAKARRLWADAKPAGATLGETYLRARGITLRPPKSLRFVARLPFWAVGAGDKKPAIIGHYPALIAGVQASNDDVIAVQRIYLNEAGTGKAPHPKPKKVLGPMHDGAVRLGRTARILGLAEGVETGLAAMQIFSIPVWATLGHVRFTAVTIPREVEKVVIFADNGKDGRVDPVALDAADELEHRGIAVVIEAPEGVKDWDDVLLSAKEIAA